MYATFKGRQCDLYNDTKQIVRRIRVANDIVNVQVQGTGKNTKVAITMKNGKTWLYSATGQIIRR